MKIPNYIIRHNKLVFMRLTKGKWAILDSCQYPIIKQYRWHAHTSSKTNYVVTSSRVRGSISMHQLLLSDAGCVDHVNGCGLDNRWSNLRRATVSENLRNRGKNVNNKSGFKGVTWYPPLRNWQAYIRYAGRNHFLGRFSSKLEAAAAYSTAALKYHKQFSKAN